MCIFKKLFSSKKKDRETEKTERIEEKNSAKVIEKELILEPVAYLSLSEMSSILLNKLDELNSKGEVYLPDSTCKIYRKEDVEKLLNLDETNKIVFVDEKVDCDDFAAKLFGQFAGIVWTNIHALNWFVDETNTLWFIEPQNDKISQNLEQWQGVEIRFFLGR